MELQVLERESTSSLLPPKSHTPLFHHTGGEKARQIGYLHDQFRSAHPPMTTNNYQSRPHHMRGVSSSVIVTSSGDKNNMANPQTTLFKAFTRKNPQEEPNEDEIFLRNPGTTVTTTRLMHKSHTPNKGVPGILNGNFITFINTVCS